MLFEIVPYVVGAAVSPVVLAMTVLLLAQAQKPIQKTLAFALGGTITASIIGTLIFLTVRTQAQSAKPTLTASVVHIVLGVVLLWLAARMWRKPAKKAKRPQKKVHYSRDFLLGVILMASNFTSLIMFVPASIELQPAASSTRFTGLALLLLATIAPMWLPLLLVTVSGKRGQKLLKKMSAFMAKHGQQVSGGLIGVIALYVLYKGLSGL